MDYDNLVIFLIKRKKVNLMFLLFDREDLSKKNLKKAILSTFKETMRVNEIALSLEIWHEYE